MREGQQRTNGEEVMGDDGVVIVFILVSLCVCMLPGMLLGSALQKTNDREKFIMYCTTKCETYVNCSDIWKGKKAITP